MYYLFFVVIFVIQGQSITAFYCKNENNEETDWFAVYKIPKIKHTNNLVENGVAYVYITATSLEWSFSQHSINASNSMIGNTLNPLYSNEVEKTDASYVIYNDQPPSEPSKNSKGHTKGVILANLEGGLWLIHSTPHFPSLAPEYRFSDSGLLKGQSFFCLSLDLKNLNNVGIQLQYNEPQIYASHIAEVLQPKLDDIVRAVSGKVVTEPPWYNILILYSKNGLKFTSFAKSKEFMKDLYEDWVAPTLQTDLFVETWLNGPGRLPSNCTKPFKVYNIESVSLKVADTVFKDSQDHSKWAVAANSSWICIGDINRMEHQKLRGGGTICLDNPKVSRDYRDSIVSMEKCNNKLN